MSMYRRRLMITNALKRSDGNINYPGIIAAWSAKGKTNDDEDRAILKDLTGNGHDIILNGFAFSEMNGYGGYKTNMLNWKYYKNSAVILSSQNKFISYNTLEITTHFWDYISNPPLGTIHRPSFKLKISGLNEDEAIYYTYRDGEDFSVPHEGNLYNGINIFPEINAEIVTEKLPYTTIFEIHNQYILNKEITFEILPEYPDALVFDGVDDYGVNRSVPSLSDYTIIVKKKALNNYGAVCATIGNFGEVAFVISDKFNRDNGMVFTNSFSLETLVKWVDNISYQTKNSYNGKTILVGKIITTHGFGISMYGGRYWKGAFYSAYLFNRSLDEQEIKTFIRKYIDPEYFLPSEIPTPDCYYDFSQGSNDDETRDTIKDLSGNGNDAVAHNFGWSGMSGYGGYNVNFLTFGSTSSNLKEKTSTKIIVNGRTNGYIYYIHPKTEVPSFKIKISGLVTDYAYVDENNIRQVIRIKEGEHILPKSYASDTITTLCGFMNPITSESTENGIIELLPEYPGALVLDGIDDYISLDAFDSGFKTVFIVCSWHTIGKLLYDQRLEGHNRKFAIYTDNGQNIAYNARNDGKTYINGVLNTSIKTKDIINIKHLITIKNNDLNFSQKPIIGAKYVPDNYFCNMALYKFLGFKEELTEEQTQAVIKKYNLLDGVNEIKVS